MPKWLRRFRKSIVSRTGWGAAHARLYAMLQPQNDVFIHHSVTYPPRWGRRKQAAHTRMIDEFHRGSRGMSTIAYSFLIYPNGRVHEGRGWGVIGGHTRGHNESSHAICFTGNFEEQKPTRKAIRSARKLIKLGHKLGYIGKPRIWAHRDVGSTACPGQRLYDRLGDLR